MRKNIIQAFSFAKRDFQSRYIGTGLGQFWFILSPIIMITIYSIIFSDFMKMKMNVVDNSYAYSIYLIPGILAWTAFSTTISRLSSSFDQRANFLKKINIPMYTFYLSTLLTEFFIFVISYFLSLIFLLIVHHEITWIFLYLIPVMILQGLFAFSIGVIVSLFTPFIKDIKVVIPIILQLWFWMTPIIYMKEMVMQKYPFILVYNPFFYFIDIYHNIFLYSKAPTFAQISKLFIMTIIVLLIAMYLYKKMISTIKDII